MLLWPFNKYPGTDYETFNWEWIIGKLKELKDSVTAVKASEKAAADSASAAAGSMGMALLYSNRAQNSAEAAAASAEFMDNLFVTPEMFGAVHDGVTDDFNAIKAAIDSGKHVMFYRNGHYHVKCSGSGDQNDPGLFKLSKGQIVDLNGATITQEYVSGSYCSLFQSKTGYNVITNGKLEGDLNAESQYWHAINLTSAETVEISNMKIENFHGDGIVINEYSTSEVPCTNIHVSNTSVTSCFRNALSIIAAQLVNIEGCYFADTSGTSPQTGIDIEPNRNYQEILDIFIHDCEFANNTSSGIAIDYHNNPAKLEVKISNCIFKDGRRPIRIRDQAAGTQTTGYITIDDITCRDVEGPFINIYGHETETIPVRINNVTVNGGGPETGARNGDKAGIYLSSYSTILVDVEILNVTTKNTTYDRACWFHRCKVKYQGDTINGIVASTGSDYEVQAKSTSDPYELYTTNTFPTASDVYRPNLVKKATDTVNSNITFGTFPAGVVIEIINKNSTHSVVINGSQTLAPASRGFWDADTQQLIT